MAKEKCPFLSRNINCVLGAFGTVDCASNYEECQLYKKTKLAKDKE